MLELKKQGFLTRHCHMLRGSEQDITHIRQIYIDSHLNRESELGCLCIWHLVACRWCHVLHSIFNEIQVSQTFSFFSLIACTEGSGLNLSQNSSLYNWKNKGFIPGRTRCLVGTLDGCLELCRAAGLRIISTFPLGLALPGRVDWGLKRDPPNPPLTLYNIHPDRTNLNILGLGTS